MPAKHMPYPYIETTATHKPTEEIEALANRRAADWGFRRGASIDEVCKNAGVDIEYSRRPNEILLDVPLDVQPVIWLPHVARKRDDRVTVATALGHWVLHVKKARQENPGCGIQALYNPDDRTALTEAQAFSLAFLMPSHEFAKMWRQGRSQAASEHFNVPTKLTYLRAQGLELGEFF